MQLQKKNELRQKRVWRVRTKVVGSAERPRLCVSFTNKHVYAQAVDDASGKTLAYESTLSKVLRAEKLAANMAGAKRLGAAFAAKAKAAGVTKVVFDRHGRQYHGCVKAFAEAAREGGLEF